MCVLLPRDRPAADAGYARDLWKTRDAQIAFSPCAEAVLPIPWGSDEAQKTKSTKKETTR